jgi:hypothetical protein
MRGSRNPRFDVSVTFLARVGQLPQARTEPGEGQAAEEIDGDGVDRVAAVADDPPWLARSAEFRVVPDVRHEPRDAEARGLGEKETTRLARNTLGSTAGRRSALVAAVPGSGMPAYHRRTLRAALTLEALCYPTVHLRTGFHFLFPGDEKLVPRLVVRGCGGVTATRAASTRWKNIDRNLTKP